MFKVLIIMRTTPAFEDTSVSLTSQVVEFDLKEDAMNAIRSIESDDNLSKRNSVGKIVIFKLF